MTIKIDQIADSLVSAPGTGMEILNHVFTGTRLYNGTSYRVVGTPTTDEASGSFIAPVSGLYRITAAIDHYVTAAIGNGLFQIVFDEGTADEKVIGGASKNWKLFVNSGSFHVCPSFVDYVELSAGSHTISVQWKRGSAGALNADTNSFVRVVAESLSGSGAGGTIVTKKELAADFFITNTCDLNFGNDFGPTGTFTWQAIDNGGGDNMEVTINTVENENVQVSIEGFSRPSSGDNTLFYHYIAIAVDGSIEKIFKPCSNLENVNRHGYSAHFSLTAGAHVIKLHGVRYSGNSACRLIGATTSASDALTLTVTQYRGGLVPVEKDGVQVIDTPRAFDFVGQGLAVTSSTGKAVIEATYDGHQEDKPPAVPSVYDDEFNGSTLDPKWSWLIAGEPSAGNEYNNVAHGRLNVCVDQISLSFANVHCLCQAIPAQNFEFYAKLYATRLTNYQGCSLVLIDSSVTHSIQMNHGCHSTGGYAALWINTWTDSYSDKYAVGSFPGNPGMYKIAYNVSTKVASFYHSLDGFNWRLLYTASALSFTPDYFGLAFFGQGSAGLTYCNVEWFRVNLL